MKNMNELFIHDVMLDSVILVYVQFVIMLVELWKVWSQELMCLCNKTTIVLSEWTVPKTTDYPNKIWQLRWLMVDVQGGSNMTGTNLYVNKCKQSRSYLNHLVYITSEHCN